MKYIDLRSDTITLPTKEMREAMYNAEVGDDVYGDDPTVRELEEYSAHLLGKESALFVPSGTFGNQLALFTHCQRGDEVLLGEDCHIVVHEVGAAAVISGVNLRVLPSTQGILEPDDIESRLRTENIHYPATGLICMENAHSNGRVIPLNNMEKIYKIAHQAGIPVHLDGARIFNAASALGEEPSKIARYCDSVMFCLSKGLCAPVGSILCGSKDFIAKALKKRKLMGGGMRQVGVLAAAGLIALKKMRKRLPEDHENALLLGTELNKIPGIKVFMEDIHINMVFFDLKDTGCNPDELVVNFKARGIKINPTEDGLMRLVTHYWVSKEDIRYIVSCLKEFFSTLS